MNNNRQDALRAALDAYAAYQAAKLAQKAALESMQTAFVEAYDAGNTKYRIAKATGLTAAYVGGIVNAHSSTTSRARGSRTESPSLEPIYLDLDI